MKIYLAGNYSMAKTQRESLYFNFFKYRLLSYYECQPGRFCSKQWAWLIQKEKKMLSVTKQFWFSASHMLVGHPVCGVMHGHNYLVEVTFKTEYDRDMVVDFHDIKEQVGPIINELDHTHLNDHYGLEEMPTAENIAKWIYRYIKNTCSFIIADPLTEVAVWETHNAVARYWE